MPRELQPIPEGAVPRWAEATQQLGDDLGKYGGLMAGGYFFGSSGGAAGAAYGAAMGAPLGPPGIAAGSAIGAVFGFAAPLAGGWWLGKRMGHGVTEVGISRCEKVRTTLAHGRELRLILNMASQKLSQIEEKNATLAKAKPGEALKDVQHDKELDEALAHFDELKTLIESHKAIFADQKLDLDPERNQKIIGPISDDIFAASIDLLRAYDALSPEAKNAFGDTLSKVPQKLTSIIDKLDTDLQLFSSEIDKPVAQANVGHAGMYGQGDGANAAAKNEHDGVHAKAAGP